MTSEWDLPRGRCPGCLRVMATLADGTIARRHYDASGYIYCYGYGKRALSPTAPVMATIAPVTVTRNALTRKWRVHAKGRYDGGYDTFEKAWDRVYEMFGWVDDGAV